MESSGGSGEYVRSASEALLFEVDPYQESLKVPKKNKRRDMMHKSNIQANQTLAVNDTKQSRADVSLTGK